MSQEKDYSLLRPFDLEAAKRGEPFVFVECGEMKDRKFIAGPDSDGGIVVQDERGRFGFSTSFPYSMAPLCWVEGRPVYKGDVLYRDKKFAATATSEGMQYANAQCVTWDTLKPDWWSWTPPKVKREGWVNVWPHESGDKYFRTFVFDTEELANLGASELLDERIACVRIEWEEPA